MFEFDSHIFSYCSENNISYTRYADDMTFSSNHNVYQEDSQFLQQLKKSLEAPTQKGRWI